MLAPGIFLIMAIGGYLGAPGWVVLLGAAAVLSEGWGMKLMRLRQPSRVPWSSKTTTYFATGVLAGIGWSAAAFWFGRLVYVLAH
jgi:hypothetical protein